MYVFSVCFVEKLWLNVLCCVCRCRLRRGRLPSGSDDGATGVIVLAKDERETLVCGHSRGRPGEWGAGDELALGGVEVICLNVT